MDVSAIFDSATFQQLLQCQIGTFGGGDAQTFKSFQITALGVEIRSHYQQPRRALRQRNGDFRPLPVGKLGEKVEDRTGDHRIGAALTQRLGRTEHRDQLDARIQSFAFEKTQLVCRQRGETSVANQIDRCDTKLHGNLQIEVSSEELGVRRVGFRTTHS